MAFQPKAGVYYHIVSRMSGDCLQVGGGDKSGAVVEASAELTPALHQQFGIFYRGYDKEVFFSIVARHSGYVLDVAGASEANGAKIIQYRAAAGLIDAKNQRFSLHKIGFLPGDYYYITARHSDKCFDVSGGSTDDGAELQQWKLVYPADNQNFIFEALGDGYWRIIARHSGKCLEVLEGNKTEGAPVVQWTKRPTNDHQRFRFEPASDEGGPGYYRIIAKHSDKCLEVEYGRLGEHIVQRDPEKGDPDQLFKVETTASGYCRLVTRKSGIFITVRPEKGAPYNVYPWGQMPDSNTQEFWLVSDETRAAQQFISLLPSSDLARLRRKEFQRLIETATAQQAAQWAADNLSLKFSAEELESVVMKMKPIVNYIQSNVPGNATAGERSSSPAGPGSGTGSAAGGVPKLDVKSRAGFEKMVVKAAQTGGASGSFGLLYKGSLVVVYSLLKSASSDSEAKAAVQNAVGAMLGTGSISSLADNANLTGSKFLDSFFFTTADVIVGTVKGVADMAKAGMDKVGDAFQTIFRF